MLLPVTGCIGSITVSSCHMTEITYNELINFGGIVSQRVS
jgi:hypothetical protein